MASLPKNTCQSEIVKVSLRTVLASSISRPSPSNCSTISSPPHASRVALRLFAESSSCTAVTTLLRSSMLFPAASSYPYPPSSFQPPPHPLAASPILFPKIPRANPSAPQPLLLPSHPPRHPPPPPPLLRRTTAQPSASALKLPLPHPPSPPPRLTARGGAQALPSTTTRTTSLGRAPLQRCVSGNLLKLSNRNTV
jgi:hypothetical protein